MNATLLGGPPQKVTAEVKKARVGHVRSVQKVASPVIHELAVEKLGFRAKSRDWIA
jgi:hypothetical protein